MKTHLLVMTLLTVSLAGCTDGDDGDGFVTPQQDAQGRYVIEVGPAGSLTFSPDQAKVPINSTVVWVNAGGFHNVAAEDGSFRSGEAATGQWEFEVTFTEAGEFDYHCEPHLASGMVGTILVE